MHQLSKITFHPLPVFLDTVSAATPSLFLYSNTSKSL